MKCKTSLFICLFIYFLVSVPRILNAQNSHDGNHCAVAKSPYRLSMDSGKMVYARECLSCHQADGMGLLNKNPPLTGKFITGDRKKLILILVGEHTSAYEAKENNPQYIAPPNPMMSDSEIASVLTYIRNSFGNKATAVKNSEVKTARSH